jgi:NAD(P)-dependent dehydrogenase (short-subunit alcohol dehydrogenase family)
VEQLALKNARVYIGGRSEERVNKAITDLNNAHNKKLDLHFLHVDLNDLRSVKAAASKFAQLEQRLDILINNAGIMAHPFKLTKDGHDVQWQSNYVAPFILTAGLMPLLLKTAAASGDKNRVRVVNVSSELAFFQGPKRIMLEDPNMADAKGFAVNTQRYSHSKQASIRHARELNERFSSQGVTAYALHPGVLKTNLQGGDPTLWGKTTFYLVNWLATMTPLEGAMTSLYAATSPNAPKKAAGKYMTPVAKVQAKADKFLNDKKGNQELWAWSENAMERV